MKKLDKIWLLLVLIILITGCMSSSGWTRKDGQPIEQGPLREQFQKDFQSCNRGAWTLTLTQYLIAKKCMERKGYGKE